MMKSETASQIIELTIFTAKHADVITKMSHFCTSKNIQHFRSLSHEKNIASY